jgi:hypothetical protein
MPLFTRVPRETVRKGGSVASEASILLASSNEIGLIGPVCSTFEAPVQRLTELFGQSLEGEFSEVRQKRSKNMLSGRCAYQHPLRMVSY